MFILVLFFYEGAWGEHFLWGGFKIMGALNSVFFSTCHQNVSPAAHQKSHEMYGVGMGGTSLSPAPHKKITLVTTSSNCFFQLSSTCPSQEKNSQCFSPAAGSNHECGDCGRPPPNPPGKKSTRNGV